MSEYKFKQNDAVRWESGGKEYAGLIKGVATTEMPVIGRMWIVDVGSGQFRAIRRGIFTRKVVLL